MEMQNLMVQMPSNGYVMMQILLVGMSWCKCPLVGMSWCKCTIEGMSWCKCTLKYVMNANVFLWVYHDMNALMRTHFIKKFPLFSKRSFLSAWNQNILKAWFITPEKSYTFLLKALQKLVITVRNPRMRHRLGIWWSGSKDLFPQFG